MKIHIWEKHSLTMGFAMLPSSPKKNFKFEIYAVLIKKIE